MEHAGAADLLSLVAVAGAPVSVDVAARALSLTPTDVIAAGAELTAAGKLVESSAGYELADGANHHVSPAASAHLSGVLAQALSATGGDPLLTGKHFGLAGQHRSAWETLSTAALDPTHRLGDAEQLGVLTAALVALAASKLDGGAIEGQVRLRLAQLYRSRGQSSDARTMLDGAIARLTGDHLITALGFAAAVEDDLQHPQESERWVALAELVAAAGGSQARLGSLLTFHGRELSRLGFAREAMETVSKGRSLLDAHGSENQRFYGHLNQAWIDFDQGQMQRAELGFARLKDEAASLEGEASQATQEAYWGRSLFGIGKPAQALAALEAAKVKAQRLGATAPMFIAHLAEAEGGLLFENWDAALDGATDALDITVHTMPPWENVARYLKARAHLGKGETEEARQEAEAALAATPAGSNGLRWRLRIEELLLEMAEPWDRARAEDLTDTLLQSHWMGAAVDLMTTRAQREKDPELAAEAAALAMQIGNPFQAARAIRAGSLWDQPIAVPVAARLRPLIEQLPEGWLPSYLDDPPAQAVLAAPVEAGDEEDTLLREKIDQALSAAGLSGDTVLSPAQRRSAGLVRRRPAVERRPMRWLGAAAAMAVIAVGAALAVVNLTAPPPTSTTTPTTAATTTTILALEATVIPAPETGLTGTAIFRANEQRSGIASGGLRDMTGYYWRESPGGSITTPLSATGRFVYFATDENNVYSLEQTGGRINFTIPTDSRVTAGPVVSTEASGEADPSLVFVTSDGRVHAYSALRISTALWPPFETGDQVTAPPLLRDQNVYVATTGGAVYAISVISGDQVWRYPLEGSAGSFVSAPSFSEGVLYLTSREGALHVIDAATGAAVCTEPIGLIGEAVTSPVVVGDAIFVGMESNSSFQVFNRTACGAPATGYSPVYPSSVPVRLGPVVTPENMFLLENRLLVAYTLDASLWTGGSAPAPWTPYQADDPITTPPVIADGVLYFGSQDGVVHAVDATNGQNLWKFNTGSALRGEAVVIPGAVFVTTASGEIIAIAGE